MAGTDLYNPVFEAVRITAIFVPVWVLVRKIPAIPANTIQNSLPWLLGIQSYAFLFDSPMLGTSNLST